MLSIFEIYNKIILLSTLYFTMFHKVKKKETMFEKDIQYIINLIELFDNKAKARGDINK